MYDSGALSKLLKLFSIFLNNLLKEIIVFLADSCERCEDFPCKMPIPYTLPDNCHLGGKFL